MKKRSALILVAAFLVSGSAGAAVKSAKSEMTGSGHSSVNQDCAHRNNVSLFAQTAKVNKGYTAQKATRTARSEKAAQ